MKSKSSGTGELSGGHGFLRNRIVLSLAGLFVLAGIVLLAGYRPFGSGGRCEGRCTVTLTVHDVPLDYEVDAFVNVYFFDENGDFSSGGVVSEAITPAFENSLLGFVTANRVLRVTRNCLGPKCTCRFGPDDEDILQKVTTVRELKYTVRVPFEDGSFVLREYTIEVDAVRSVFNGTCVDTPLVPEAEVIPPPAGG